MAGALTYALSLKTRGFTGPMSAARGGLNKFSSGVGGLITKIGPLASGLLAAGGAAGAFGIALKSFNVAADLEQTQVALRTLIGDVGKADALLESVRKLGASTPFEFPELANSARMLAAFGTAAEEIPRTLSTIGDIASGVQMPVKELAELYGKAQTQGTLYAEDLNQLTGRGIPILDELAKVMGVNVSEVKKLASEGKVTFPLMSQAFNNMTGEGGKFFQMMQKQSETSRGLVSTLKDNVNELFITLGTPINDALKPVFKDAIAMVQQVGSGLSALVTLTQEAVKQGQLGEIIKTSLQIGVMEGVNYAAGAFAFLAEGLYRSMEFSLRQVWTFLSGGFSEVFGNVFKGVGLMFDGLGKIILSKLSAPFLEIITMFQAGMSVAVDKVIAGLLKLPGARTLLGFDEWDEGSFDDYQKEYKEKMKPQKLKDAGQQEIRDGLAEVGKAVEQYGELSSGNFKTAFDGFDFEKVEIFDVNAEKERLAKIGKSLDPEAYQKLMDAMGGSSSAPSKPSDQKDKKPAVGQGAQPAQKGAANAGAAADKTAQRGKRKGLLGAAESLAARYSRQAGKNKGSFKDFVNKSGLSKSAVRSFAKNKGISMDAALAQLQRATRAASPRQARRNAAEKAARDAAGKAATETTLLTIASKMETIAVA